MAIRVQCPCGKVFSVPDSYAGKNGRCTHCGSPLVVPTPTTPEDVDVNASGEQIVAFGSSPELGVPPAPTLSDGGAQKTVGGYGIHSRLGEADQKSTVFVAQSPGGETVALKLLPEKLMASSPTMGKRFLREARTLSGLRHDNVAALLDAGEDLGTFYLAMEYFHGKTLKEALRERGALPEAEAMNIAVQVAQGLGFLEKNGLVHRNIKPEHIMVGGDGKVKLVGLGLIRAAQEQEDTPQLTVAGTFVGDPRYTAPETARGQRTLDVRTDLYSLGVTLYEALSGVPPFDDPVPSQVTLKHMKEAVPPLIDRNPDVSRPMAMIVEHLLNKKPEQRYQSAASLISDLEAVRTGDLVGGIPPLLARGETPAATGTPQKAAPEPGAPQSAGDPTMKRLLAALTVVGVLIVVLLLVLILRD